MRVFIFTWISYTLLAAERYNFDDPDWDIHVLAGSLKLFFRELKEPLFPFSLFNKFLDAISK